MDPLTLALVMGGVGLAKGATVDKAKQYKQAQVQAETTRYSPWTHMTAKEPTEADPLGQGIAGAAYGYQLGQNNKAFEADQALKKSMTELNQRSSSLPLTNYNYNSSLSSNAPQWASMQDMSNGPGGYSLFGRNR